MPTNENDSIKFLTVKEIVRLHEEILNETGGEHGILNIGHIEFAVDFISDRAFSPETTDIFRLAALLVRNIISGHPFVDGNKRTGLEAADVLLGMNGYYIKFEKEKGIAFAVAVAQGDLDKDSIRDWLRENSTKSRYMVKDGVITYSANMKEVTDVQRKEKTSDISEETMAIIKESIQRNLEFLKELAKH